jgi:hypothetical protein
MTASAFEQDPEDVGSFVGNNSQSLVESAQAIFRPAAQAGEDAIASVGENLASKATSVVSDIGENLASKAASVAGAGESAAASTGEAVGEAASAAAEAGTSVLSTAASVLGPVGLVAGLALSIYDIVDAFEKPTSVIKEAKPVFVSGL